MTKFCLIAGVFTITAFFTATTTHAQDPNSILLKNYRPHSIYKVPVTKITKAKYPVIDMHSHSYMAKSKADITHWIALMDKFGIEKTILFTATCGPQFDSIYHLFAPYTDRFEIWCSFDFSGFGQPGWADKAVKELERCVKMGARGVGELGDKGLGEIFGLPVPGGMHLDDPRLQPLYKKCADLKIPVSIHVADPMWMYEPMDSTNDGLMNAYDWRIDPKQPGLRGHAEMLKTLENIVSANPQTTFIACHLANCAYDLSLLGNLLSKYRNLYADFGARFGEIAPVPRYTAAFFKKYQDRLVYGTDMDPTEFMYETTFRILQTADEHFYATELFGYHWPLEGLDLDDATLKKIYKDNATKLLKK